MGVKTSIIIPIYNTEKYLKRCINSVLKQTEHNIEIILVDDGSIDSCPIICDNYAKADTRVKVVHKTNGGLSTARNAGLEVATGDFVTFIDSDDWIEKDAVEYALKCLIKYDADAFEYEYVYVKGEKDRIRSRKENLKVYCNKDILQFFMTSTTKRGNYSVCVCFFKRGVLNNIQFREGKIAEDGDFKYRAYEKCKKLVASNLQKYYYFQSGDSISTGGLKKKDFQIYEAAEELCVLTQKEEYGTIKRLALVKKARTPLSLLCRIAVFGINDPQIEKDILIRRLQKELRCGLYLLLFSPIPISRKILAIMFSCNYYLTEKTIHVFSRQ